MAGFYGRTGIEFTNTLGEGLARVEAVIRPAAIAAVTAAAAPIILAAYDKANVSAGEKGHGVNGEHMRDEIKATVFEYENGVSARIGIDMSIIPYAAHQEFGVRGKPFLRPAIDENRDEAHRIMAAVMREHLADARNIRTKVRFRAFA